ncbi:MAG TPA: hypothetical protein VNJ06_09875 [Gemmatimonadales bacterium]|nr:hypothetical protein [Gemmatimonadales bacterium]
MTRISRISAPVLALAAVWNAPAGGSAAAVWNAPAGGSAAAAWNAPAGGSPAAGSAPHAPAPEAVPPRAPAGDIAAPDTVAAAGARIARPVRLRPAAC